MALVLGMQLEKDNEIYLNDLRIEVDGFLPPDQAQITVHGDYMTEKLILSEHRMSEVIPGVSMMLSKGVNNHKYCRILVEAPRSVKVERGARYHQADE